MSIITIKCKDGQIEIENVYIKRNVFFKKLLKGNNLDITVQDSVKVLAPVLKFLQYKIRKLPKMFLRRRKYLSKFGIKRKFVYQFKFHQDLSSLRPFKLSLVDDKFLIRRRFKLKSTYINTIPRILVHCHDICAICCRQTKLFTGYGVYFENDKTCHIEIYCRRCTDICDSQPNILLFLLAHYQRYVIKVIKIFSVTKYYRWYIQ